MNLYRLGLNEYQRHLINSGEVELQVFPGPAWFAEDIQGNEGFAKTARDAMDNLEVARLNAVYELPSATTTKADPHNEFNTHDEGEDYLI